ncbi:MAG TPA: DUF1684 domain-containing protein [Thermoanaerobaculia bacterium]|nr:DUF1684 domain-containing protein [Thermoanaerobaculia bacterium]
MNFFLARVCVLTLGMALLTSACGKGPTGSSERAAPGVQTPSLADDVETWRAKRLSRLAADDGWLTLAGLYWLEEGANRVGSAPGSEVLLPRGASTAGVMRRRGDEVRFEPAGDSGISVKDKPVQSMVLVSDKKDEPTILRSGPVSFYLIERGDRIGVRVKDTESNARKSFKGIEMFPVDPRWNVEATFEPYNPPKEIPILNIIGIVETMRSPGQLKFAINGRQLTLDPVTEEGSDELFIIFKDATSGRSTYGAGRYLYASMPDKGGKVQMNFNKSYNPPCAFTPFATCPLPPLQNRLPIEIPAGEKLFQGGPH